ncbi:MAG: hypothetical protein HUU55_03200 [Myxococcales bacterium]|nr:hypothetical protein [Myxococcales bacterium]
MFVISACREAPQNVYERAVLAQEEKNFDQYVVCFDRPSQKILREVDRLEKDTRGRIRHLRNPYDLAIWGEFESEQVYEDYAVVTARVSKTSQQVIFHLEDGQWKISLCNVERFWRLPR